MAKPIECTEINTTGTLVVLEEAAKAGVKKLLFSSSAAIYGDNPVVPKVETMLPEPKSQYAAAVPIFIDRAVKNLPITIYGDGEQTRDFIYVKDIAAANAFFATQSPATGVFNVAYGQRITIKKIVALTGSKSEIQHTPERAGDVKHSMAAIEKLRAAGHTPASSFAAGLAATTRYFQNRS